MDNSEPLNDDDPDVRIGLIMPAGGRAVTRPRDQRG
jgi:hypothetical protein